MDERTKAFTLGRALAAWGVLCTVGWLVLGAIAEVHEAECRAENGWFCFDPGVALIVVGVLAIGAVALGSVLIAVVWWLVELAINGRRHRARGTGNP